MTYFEDVIGRSRRHQAARIRTGRVTESCLLASLQVSDHLVDIDRQDSSTGHPSDSRDLLMSATPNPCSSKGVDATMRRKSSDLF
jgi:hypothetical protein